MKVLNKQITSSFLVVPENYREVKKQWAEKMESNECMDGEVHLLYLTLMGKDWTKSFVQGNSIDFENGGLYGSGPYMSLKNLILSLKIDPSRILSKVADISLFADDAHKKLLETLPDLECLESAIQNKASFPEYFHRYNSYNKYMLNKESAKEGLLQTIFNMFSRMFNHE